ncbi:MAG TPA: hypothetical protein V6C90_21075 [Coleofasciculaceae cyanobacterium]
MSETIITAKIAPTEGQFLQLRVLVLLKFGVQRARFDSLSLLDRTSQSPRLVVGRWCGTKYGLVIAVWQ